MGWVTLPITVVPDHSCDSAERPLPARPVLGPHLNPRHLPLPAGGGVTGRRTHPPKAVAVCRGVADAPGERMNPKEKDLGGLDQPGTWGHRRWWAPAGGEGVKG